MFIYDLQLNPDENPDKIVKKTLSMQYKFFLEKKQSSPSI
jgi:hypothetical protein